MTLFSHDYSLGRSCSAVVAMIVIVVFGVGCARQNFSEDRIAARDSAAVEESQVLLRDSARYSTRHRTIDSIPKPVKGAALTSAGTTRAKPADTPSRTGTEGADTLQRNRPDREKDSAATVFDREREDVDRTPNPDVRHETLCDIQYEYFQGSGIAFALVSSAAISDTVDGATKTAMVVRASDKDLLAQRCTCYVDGVVACIDYRSLEVFDDLTYRWVLTGAGSLESIEGPVALYAPPPGADEAEAIVRLVVRDGRKNDEPVRATFKISYVRIGSCAYKRTVTALASESSATPVVSSGSGSACACKAQEPEWIKPKPLAGSVEIRLAMCVGESRIISIPVIDRDGLVLTCAGKCGKDIAMLEEPDQVTSVWTSVLDGFPDYTGATAQTIASPASVVYRAPLEPGIDTISIAIEDSGEQASDAPIEATIIVEVYDVDLDIDSDNTVAEASDGTHPDPERTGEEDNIEDGCSGEPGKTVLVNNGDMDRDCIPDFADGFNMFGQKSIEASRPFVPLILEIPEPFDTAKARIRFIYVDSDPAKIRRRSAQKWLRTYKPEPGNLRIWTKDGPESREKKSAGDDGDFVASDTLYKLSDLGAAIAPRTRRLYVEAVNPSAMPADGKIRVDVFPDGKGAKCSDSVMVAIVAAELIAAETFKPVGIGYTSRSRPQIELDPLKPADISFSDSGTVHIAIAGTIRDRIADIIPAGAANINEARIGETTLPVTPLPTPTTKARPYAFRGGFSGNFETQLSTGTHEFSVATSENALGMVGRQKFFIACSPGAPGMPGLTIDSTWLGEPSAAGSFHAYFAGVDEQYGPEPSVTVDGVERPLEPRPGSATARITVEPFIFLDTTAAFTDDRLITARFEDLLEWRFKSVRGKWNLSQIDIAADNNGDDEINAEDDSIEEIVALRVDPNSDDDDGDEQPDNADDSINGDDDRDDMQTIVVRRPPMLSPLADARCIIRQVSGSGKTRLFLEAGGVEIMAPDAEESADLWDVISEGEATLLVEGVAPGDVTLEAELAVCNTVTVDQLALSVQPFVLSLGIDLSPAEPDGSAEADDGYVHIPADFLVRDEQTGAEVLGVEFFAMYFNLADLEADSAIPERTILWEVEAYPGNTSRTPKLQDLNNPLDSATPRESEALVEAGFSRTRLTYTFTHAAENKDWVKAGDRFIVRVRAPDGAGGELTQEIHLLITPGRKVFHVVNPPPDFLARKIWRLSDADFAAAYAEYDFVAPPGSGAMDSLRLFVFDQFRNVLESGRPASWNLRGSGRIGVALEPAHDNPIVTEGVHVELADDGELSATFIQDRYPSCPWQPEHPYNPSEVSISIDGITSPANVSQVVRGEPLPVSIGPLRLQPYGGSVIPQPDSLDLFKGESWEFRVELVRETGDGGELPVENVDIQFTSTNGKLGPRDGVARTGADGSASITLTSDGARIGEIIVLAAVGDMRLRISEPGMRWFSSAPTTMQAEHSIIAADATQDGVYRVETLQDEGEAAAFPGAVEGDGLLDIPYFAKTKITLRGLPDHVYDISLRDDISWDRTSVFPLDTLDRSGFTPDIKGDLTALASGSKVDTSEKFEGRAALFFDGSAELVIEDAPTLDMDGGLRFALALRPASLEPGVVLERAGQYRLEILAGGALQLTAVAATGDSLTVVSAQSLAVDTWNLVDALFEKTKLRLSVGPRADSLIASVETFTTTTLATPAAQLKIGTDFRGHIDEIRIVKRGNVAAPVELVGLDADGTVTTDEHGVAEFYVRSTGAWDPERYAPAKIRIEASGSLMAALIIYAAPKSIQAHLINIGKAFLMGTESLGSDAGWFEKASAWVSEMIPFASDLRELGYQAYKAATGCDEVSKLNVAFAVVGLVVDIASFGLAGQAVKIAGKSVFKSSTKLFLKEFGQNVVIGAATTAAIAGFIELSTKEVLRADNKKEVVPADWVLQTKQYMDSLREWVRDEGVAGVLDVALQSVPNIFQWFAIYRDLGAAETRVMFEPIAAPE